MAGSLVKNNNPAKPNEMRVKEPPSAPPHHAYGEGGPEKQSGREGPDTMPARRGRKED